MPIQFTCQQCQRPIEVDDEVAGRTAVCPYCRVEVVVPRESTLDAQTVPGTARPIGTGSEEAAGRTAPPLPGGPMRPAAGRTPRRAAASWSFAAYSLICTSIVVVLLVVQMVAMVGMLVEELRSRNALTSQPSPEQMQETQLVLVKRMSASPFLMAGGIGLPFFAIIGLALGIAGVRQGGAGVWRAWTSVFICGFCTACMCAVVFNSSAAGGP